MKIYREALRLHAEGYGCKMIARILSVSPSTVGDWIKGRYSPYGPRPPELPPPRHKPGPKPVELKPTPELAYVIGAVLGDGYASRRGYSFAITLRAKDREFVEEFARFMSNVLGGRVRVALERSRGRFYAGAYSRALYEVLKKPPQINKLRPYIEHCTNCTAAFIRGFADAEGSIDHRFGVRIFNTNIELLRYVQRLLARLDIETTGPRLKTLRGTILRDLRAGKTYLRRRDIYLIRVRAKSIPRFYEEVGFTIRRKQARPEQCLKRKRKPLPQPFPSIQAFI